MGCCSPNYRNTVNEKEQQLNQKGKDTLPVYVKFILVAVCVGALLAVAFID